ncbi:uncharacterized protein METZ01_LOCUS357599, partial [marine metagenome]
VLASAGLARGGGIGVGEALVISLGASMAEDFLLGTLTEGAPIVDRHSFSSSINADEYAFWKLSSNDFPLANPSKWDCILLVPLDMMRNSVKLDPTAYINQISSGVFGLFLKYSRLGSEESRIASEMARE